MYNMNDPVNRSSHISWGSISFHKSWGSNFPHILGALLDTYPYYVKRLHEYLLDSPNPDPYDRILLPFLASFQFSLEGVVRPSGPAHVVSNFSCQETRWGELI